MLASSTVHVKETNRTPARRAWNGSMDALFFGAMDEITFGRLEAKYANYASWAIWNPDELKDTTVIRRSLDSLKPSMVMVALNVSRPLPHQWCNFHGSDHARKLAYAFNHSSYRGAYMTDLIKGEPEPNSKLLMRRIENGNINIGQHINTFRTEMCDLGVNHETLFISLGGDVTRLFSKLLGNTYPNRVSCAHYSKRGTDAEWVTKAWRVLEEHHRATFRTFNTPEFVVDPDMRRKWFR